MAGDYTLAMTPSDVCTVANTALSGECTSQARCCSVQVPAVGIPSPWKANVA